MERGRNKRKVRGQQIRSNVRHRQVRPQRDGLLSVPIKDFEHYKITKSGKIFSKDGEKKCSIKNGYFFCWLHSGGNSKMFYLHRLLALAFIPNPDKYMYVDHIDGNKLNNSLSNLRWCSQSANVRNQHKKRRDGLRGCYYHKQNNRWCSSITVNKKKIALGCFATEVEANAAYEHARKLSFNK